MKKIKYVFGIAAIALPLFFTSCLKSDDQIQGQQGKQGAAGLAGGNFSPVYKDIFVLSAGSLQQAGTGKYVYKWGFSTQSHDTDLTFFVTAYGAKINLNGRSPDWYAFPYPKVYTTDLLSLSVKNSPASDTVIITYTSPTPWPNDSSMNCTIIAIGQQNN